MRTDKAYVWNQLESQRHTRADALELGVVALALVSTTGRRDPALLKAAKL